jgi:dienelactone hydrolase
MRILVLVLMLALPGALWAETPVASLADGRDGTVFFASSTPSGPDQYLADPQAAPAAVVSGVLRFPTGSARVAGVVLSHSAGGVSTDRDVAWAERLTAGGMATFVVDSFGPRGVTGFANQPSSFASVADVFAALHLLATHPRIDPARIAVMGFSRGGTVALVSALEPVRRIGAPDGLRFAAHVALYPVCNVRYLAEATTGAPVLMLLGGADDQAPAEPCHRYGAWFQSKGTVARVVEYPGAYHLFDGTEPAHFVAQAVTAATCDLEYDIDARVLRRTDTGAVLTGAASGTYYRTCAARGIHVGGNDAARAGAEREIAAFFKATLGAP